MNSTKILKEEHVNILKVVAGLEEEISELEEGKRIDDEFLRKVIDFVRHYADKFHHAKEEDIFFKEFNRLAEKGEVHCNPVEQMLHEHEIGREAIKKIEEGMEKRNREMVIEGMREYVGMIREHIFKEDEILYPMADDALSDEAQEKMLKKFKDVENERDVGEHLEFMRNL